MERSHAHLLARAVACTEPAAARFAWEAYELHCWYDAVATRGLSRDAVPAQYREAVLVLAKHRTVASINTDPKE